MERENGDSKTIGWTCAYTPFALIDAAGFEPFRILPMGEPPDRAGQWLHENLCPHVKVVLDRALADDLPPFAGMVFMTSCDAMRRLSDAWKVVRNDRIHVIDLPADLSESSIRYLAVGFRELAATLEGWGGREVTDENFHRAIVERDTLAAALEALSRRRLEGTLAGGAARLQQIHNVVSSLPVAEALKVAEAALSEPAPEEVRKGVPIYLFGNVMPDPQTLTLLEGCGGQIRGDDLCTGSRWLGKTAAFAGADPYYELAKGLLSRPPCARTVHPGNPSAVAEQVVRQAKGCDARGVVCHTLKFCDPYLARLPSIREKLRDVGLPLLVLEGDCTMRSLGQQRTRIEAFMEMLG